MTLGLDVTDNDPIHGWEDCKPEPLSEAEKAYREQRAIADEMERRYSEMVESWVATKNYDAMYEFSKECTAASEKAYELSRQRFCKHTRAHLGEMYCPDCNKRLED
jgi:hypothetical protein